MNTFIAKLALEWLRAERLARNVKRVVSGKRDEVEPVDVDQDRDQDELAIAGDRVYAVLSGDVRWSEASPGDKAIWRGKFRDVEKFDRWWRQATAENPQFGQPVNVAAPSDDPFNQTTPRPREGTQRRPPPIAARPSGNRSYCNLYDTIGICNATNNHMFPTRPTPVTECCLTPGRRETSAFTSNGHVGIFHLTNMLVPGQLGEQTWAYIDTWYASSQEFGALAKIAGYVVCRFSIGSIGSPANDASDWIHLSDLVMGVPVKKIINPRVLFRVQVRHSIPSDVEIDPCLVTFHLEGVRVER